MRQFFIVIILVLGVSCSADKSKTGIKENIRFDFSAERMKGFKGTIEVKASLYNDNPDTVYFLSASCDGEQYRLRYDNTKFVLKPFMNCNVSYPVVQKIAPKGRFDFTAHFFCSDSVAKVRLGFDFYSVDKSFDIKNKSPEGIDIFDRPTDEQIIIWADEKPIKQQCTEE